MWIPKFTDRGTFTPKRVLCKLGWAPKFAEKSKKFLKIQRGGDIFLKIKNLVCTYADNTLSMEQLERGLVFTTAVKSWSHAEPKSCIGLSCSRC